MLLLLTMTMIACQNTVVSDGAKLTIVASQNITILTTLNVDAESEFEMRIQ